MSGIRLSEKHGVNPSIAVCFYCGKEKNELVLPGRLPNDKEAPRKAVWNREPCTECKGWMEKGIIFVSCKDGEAGSDNPYRTGRFAVLKEEAVKRMVQPESLLNQILRARFTFVEDKVWDLLQIPVDSEKE